MIECANCRIQQFFFSFIKDSLKWSQNKNLLFLWYEDINADFENKVRELSKFLGFPVSEEQMKVDVILRHTIIKLDWYK